MDIKTSPDKMDASSNSKSNGDTSSIIVTHIQPPHGYALSGKIMLIAIVILFSIVFIILFIHLYVRWHVYRRESRRRRRRLVFVPAAAAAAPRGLDPAILNSLDVEIFSSDDAEAAECAVCLCDFEEGEKMRVLPRCGHRFHIACIDMWFGSHSSCPLCRSAVEAPPEAKVCSPPPQSCAAASESSSEASPETTIEIAEREQELGLGFGSTIKRYLFGALSLSRGREADLERGEAMATAE